MASIDIGMAPTGYSHIRQRVTRYLSSYKSDGGRGSWMASRVGPKSRYQERKLQDETHGNEAGMDENSIALPEINIDVSASVVDTWVVVDEAIAKMFRRLIVRLGRLFPIEKASLALYDPDKNRLCVTHMFAKRTVKAGLTLTIPSRNSILYQILEQGYPIVDHYPELMTSDLVERKLLLGSAARSVLVIPLVSGGVRLGLASLTSSESTAFSLYLEGEGEEIVDQFVERLEALLPATTPVV